MAKLIDAGFGYLEGRQAKYAADAEAKQMELAAAARRAAGTQDAYEQRKIGEQVASDAIAAMAAGGGGVSDNILADIKTTADYNVLSTLFAGEQEAKGMIYAAKLKKHEGKMAKRMATTKSLVNVGEAVGSAVAGGAPKGGSANPVGGGRGGGGGFGRGRG
jgi:hypothetical protein